MGELVKALEKHHKDNVYPFHMPGHKRQADWIINPYEYDITEISHFDDLHNPKEILKNLQDRFRDLYGCKEAFLILNGSTGGILSSISAVMNSGETILLARNCHKSVYNGVFLKRCKTEYIYPQINTKTGISLGISSKDVENAFAKNSDIKAVVITSPTYEGVISNIDEIADIVHCHKAILMVDAAHGAHIGIKDGRTIGASKADLVVTSLHKTLPAFTQTALLCVNNDKLLSNIKKYINIFETTSPSYLFLAGAECCIDYISDKNIFAEFDNKIQNLRAELNKLSRLKLFATEDYDYSKMVIDTSNANISGKELKNLLLNKYNIELEMASANYALAMTSCMDTEEGFNRLASALIEIDNALSAADKHNNSSIKKTAKVYEAWECENANTEAVWWLSSRGYVSSEYVYIYPPGIPILVPGEIITEEIIKELNEMILLGIEVKGLINNERINVIKGCFYG